eukprot:COSAG05_NODE_127_length_17241_cov_7.514817_10_plen_110_part_00
MATVNVTFLSPVPTSVGFYVNLAAAAGGCTLHAISVDGQAKITPEPRPFGPVGLPFSFSSALEPTGTHHTVVGHYSCHSSSTVAVATTTSLASPAAASRGPTGAFPDNP